MLSSNRYHCQTIIWALWWVLSTINHHSFGSIQRKRLCSESEDWCYSSTDAVWSSRTCWISPSAGESYTWYVYLLFTCYWWRTYSNRMTRNGMISRWFIHMVFFWLVFILHIGYFYAYPLFICSLVCCNFNTAMYLKFSCWGMQMVVTVYNAAVIFGQKFKCQMWWKCFWEGVV